LFTVLETTEVLMENLLNTLTPPSLKLLYGTKEACGLLAIKPKKLYDLIDRGLIRKHPGFTKVLISRSELERFASLL
jgi:excisionase family DNA binding protein